MNKETKMSLKELRSFLNIQSVYTDTMLRNLILRNGYLCNKKT